MAVKKQQFWKAEQSTSTRENEVLCAHCPKDNREPETSVVKTRDRANVATFAGPQNLVLSDSEHKTASGHDVRSEIV
ncbi:MAG: hypothetical protein V1492_05800 [Candidatus Micrarchaeota archaeon]